MNRGEFVELMEWATPRWPQYARMEGEVLEAIYQDLRGWRADDITEAMRRLHTRAATFPPLGKDIVNLLTEMGCHPEKALPGPCPHPQPGCDDGVVWCHACGGDLGPCGCSTEGGSWRHSTNRS